MAGELERKLGSSLNEVHTILLKIEILKSVSRSDKKLDTLLKKKRKIAIEQISLFLKDNPQVISSLLQNMLNEANLKKHNDIPSKNEAVEVYKTRSPEAIIELMIRILLQVDTLNRRSFLKTLYSTK